MSKLNETLFIFAFKRFCCIYFVLLLSTPFGFLFSKLNWSRFVEMGNKISIDKYVSNLDDILKLNTKYFSTIKFENENIPETVAQHLKVHFLFALALNLLGFF